LRKMRSAVTHENEWFGRFVERGAKYFAVPALMWPSEFPENKLMSQGKRSSLERG